MGDRAWAKLVIGGSVNRETFTELLLDEGYNVDDDVDDECIATVFDVHERRAGVVQGTAGVRIDFSNETENRPIYLSGCGLAQTHARLDIH